jgi:hypothetical protein
MLESRCWGEYFEAKTRMEKEVEEIYILVIKSFIMFTFHDILLG